MVMVKYNLGNGYGDMKSCYYNSYGDWNFGFALTAFIGLDRSTVYLLAVRRRGKASPAFRLANSFFLRILR